MVEMTDFYSVLQRAVSSLPDSSGPHRRAVYDKARKALLKQLQSFDPPLPSADVTAQRLALEDAIRKIENEIARQIRTQRALQTAVPSGTNRARPAAPGNGDAAAARAAEEERRAQKAAEAERARRQNAELLQAAITEATVAPEPVEEPPVLKTPPVPVSAPHRREPQAPLPDDDMDMFEADAPGHPDDDVAFDSASQRDADIVDGEYDEVEPESDGEFDEAPADDPREDKRKKREELRARKDEERRLRAERRSSRKPARKDRKPKRKKPQAAEDEGRRRKRRAGPGIGSRAILPIILLALLAGASYAAYTQREALLSVMAEFQQDPADRPPITVTGTPVEKNADRLPTTVDGEETRTVTTTEWPPRDTGDSAPAEAQEGTSPAPNRTVGGEAAPFVPDDQSATPAEEQTTAVASATPTEPEPAQEPSTPITEFTASGTQQAILIEESARAGEPGTAVPGGVEWAMVRQSVGGGEPEPVIRATASIPERNITATITMRENRDGALPASHLIEIAFNLPDGFEGGGVKNVPGVIMKESEQARGEALRGAAARVSAGLFWIALSEADADRETNLRLLRERDWVDIPILYESGRRAILTLRKGRDGFQSVDAAIRAWSPG
ncbi:MAG: hypothetical protein AAGF45_07200 [Pseudomonadota bacterium]